MIIAFIIAVLLLAAISSVVYWPFILWAREKSDKSESIFLLSLGISYVFQVIFLLAFLAAGIGTCLAMTSWSLPDLVKLFVLVIVLVGCVPLSCAVPVALLLKRIKSSAIVVLWSGYVVVELIWFFLLNI